MTEIKNTVSFSYPNGSSKPTIAEMASFVKTLNSNPGDMHTMYRIGEEKAVFIKYKDEAAMRYALMNNPEQLPFRYANGKTVEVRMSLAGGLTQYVRVYDLPPEVSDDDVGSVLGRYGTVKRVIREKFPADTGLDMFTGVRGVYMEVEKEIPSALHFRDRKGHIFYVGNKDKCFLCREEGHKMISCPKRMSRTQHQSDMINTKKEKQTVTRTTYADAVISEPSLDGSSLEAEEETAEQDEKEKETGNANIGKREAENQRVEVMEEDFISSDDGISEEEAKPSYQDNPFYKIALQMKKKIDEEKENKRLQEKKSVSKKGKGKK